MRFTFFALPLLLLSLALYAFGLDMFASDTRLGVSFAELSRLSGWTVLGGWLLEALGLTGLFLLLYGRAGNRWLDGLATGWIAWVFRAPLLVLTIGAARVADPADWWPAVLGWLVLYTWCGLLLASLARSVRLTPHASDET